MGEKNWTTVAVAVSFFLLGPVICMKSGLIFRDAMSPSRLPHVARGKPPKIPHVLPPAGWREWFPLFDSWPAVTSSPDVAGWPTQKCALLLINNGPTKKTLKKFEKLMLQKMGTKQQTQSVFFPNFISPKNKLKINNINPPSWPGPGPTPAVWPSRPTNIQGHRPTPYGPPVAGCQLHQNQKDENDEILQMDVITTINELR